MTRARSNQTALATIMSLAVVSAIAPGPASAQLKQAPPAVAPRPATQSTPAAKPADDIIALQTGKPIVSKGRTWQSFTDYIHLNQGQDQAPLTLTILNGPDNAPAFEQCRITLAGRDLATMKDFKNRALNVDLTGVLGVGDTQLIVQAVGPAGAAMSWKLTSKKIVVTSVDPTTISPGDKIKVNGKNFTAKALVSIGQKWCKVTQAKETQLQVTVPDDVESGKQNLIVTVGGVKSAPIPVSVKGAPQVSGIDTISAPPGQQVTISGKGFSTKAADNIVTFNGTPGTVVSASATSLTVVIPEIAYPQWNVQIKVKTNGVESKGDTTINVQQRVIPNDGVPES
ncbi:MAG TPA: IPT/TIG domain-containing protein [Candidatus Obscuribacterales bacterium]